MYKETPLCPQCKAPFHYLYVHRQLDGTVSDYPLEESVVLLKRASWFTEHLKVSGVGELMCYCGADVELGTGWNFTGGAVKGVSKCTERSVRMLMWYCGVQRTQPRVPFLCDLTHAA